MTSRDVRYRRSSRRPVLGSTQSKPSFHTTILIETIDSLKGERSTRAGPVEGSGKADIYILLAKENRRMSEVDRLPRVSERLTPERKGGNPRRVYRGIQKGRLRRRPRAASRRSRSSRRTRGSEKELAQPKTAPRRAGRVSNTSIRFNTSRRATSASTSSLLRRSAQPGSADPARSATVIAAAEAKAEAMGLKMNIAVVDDGGHLLAFARMDGARPASGYTAITKATTAATFREPTGPFPPAPPARPPAEPQPADRGLRQRRQDHHPVRRRAGRGRRPGHRRRGRRRRQRRARRGSGESGNRRSLG